MVTVPLPAHPFRAIPSHDGCWVFVSLIAGDASQVSGVGVLRRGEGRLALAHVVPLKANPLGLALTHDGKLLIVAAGDSVLVLDVSRLKSGEGDPVLGAFDDGPNAGSVYVNVTADDRTLFVSDEGAAAITVIDLARARLDGYSENAMIGKIPVGGAPIALTFSPEGRWLYTTSESATSEWGWPKACKEEGSSKATLDYPEGAVVVIDVARAIADPRNSVAARVPAGCSPVRLAISPRGDFLYVTARNSNAALAFESAKLVKDSAHARVGSVPVGNAPVPVAVIKGGKRVVVGNSDRFAANPQTPQTLTIIDAAKFRRGADAVLGTVPTGAFPREMSVSSDGRTLFLTNALSNSLQVMNAEHLPVAK